MKQTLTAALIVLITIISTTATQAQVLVTSTARQYLPASTTFTQSSIDSYNTAVVYQADIIGGLALTFPDLAPIQLSWDGTQWTYPTPVSITSNFGTLLMAGPITHTATATPGATNPSITVDWADISGVTQYRFRIRPLNGTWNTSTITGSQRTLTNLTYSTTYEVQVRVYLSSSVQGEYTQAYTFTTPTFVPLPVCAIPTYSVTKGSDSIRFNINSQTNAIGYQIQVRALNSLAWGGTTISSNYKAFAVQPNTGYEYQLRTNCVNSQTTWSAFGTTDTITDAICTPPTGLTNTGNTFSWTSNQYAKQTQIQTRLLGTTNWGGSTVTGNTRTFPYLWGQHEWRVRSICYATTNGSWTDWAYGLTNFIPNPNTFEQYETELAYPNPCNEVLRYNGKIVLRDVTGRVVATGENEVDTHQLSVGMYFIGTQKIIVKH